MPPKRDRDRARLLRWHGLDRTSKADFRCEQTITEPGYRYHLTDDLATVGLANLAGALRNVERARANAAWYDRVLRNVPGVRLLPFDPACDYWLFDVLIDGDRDGFMAFLGERGVATSRVHARNDTHPAYSFPNGPLPGVEAFDSQHVALPVGWWVSDADREHIARAVIEWAQLQRPDAEIVREVAYA
jgi:dTDP-4-amino-4,6-dideoxygalactose transaminase